MSREAMEIGHLFKEALVILLASSLICEITARTALCRDMYIVNVYRISGFHLRQDVNSDPVGDGILGILTRGLGTWLHSHRQRLEMPPRRAICRHPQGS